MSDEHGIAEAAYTWAGRELRPHLFCLCEYRAWGEDWEDAGAELDDHLESVNR